MTSDQYKALIQDLAHVAGLSDASSLLEYGRVMIGEGRALLVHDPDHDPDLLQVRVTLGNFAESLEVAVLQALMETNYVKGYAGDCVFSLRPGAQEAVLTMRLRLRQVASAQDLWQSLSDIARHGRQMWEEIMAEVAPRQLAFPPALHPPATANC